MHRRDRHRGGPGARRDQVAGHVPIAFEALRQAFPAAGDTGAEKGPDPEFAAERLDQQPRRSAPQRGGVHLLEIALQVVGDQDEPQVDSAVGGFGAALDPRTVQCGEHELGTRDVAVHGGGLAGEVDDLYGCGGKTRLGDVGLHAQFPPEGEARRRHARQRRHDGSGLRETGQRVVDLCRPEGSTELGGQRLPVVAAVEHRDQALVQFAAEQRPGHLGYDEHAFPRKDLNPETRIDDQTGMRCAVRLRLVGGGDRIEHPGFTHVKGIL